MTEIVAAPMEEFPPGVHNFDYRDWFTGLSDTPLSQMITSITAMVFLAVALLIGFFMWSYRDPQIVPTKRQWMAESVYDFVRNGVTIDLLGEKQGIKFAPYMATLFCFIALTNVFAIVPGLQISPNAHIAFPIVLGVLSWVIYNYVGIRKHGFVAYLKVNTVPPGVPGFILPLMVPIEFFTNLLLRPVTLALRLFANMFAGHLILLVFTLGGFSMLNNDNFAIQGMSIFAFAMAIAMTFFEFAIQLLQAYVFVLLTTMYVQGALADEH